MAAVPSATTDRLPPGQRAVQGFPRFGKDLDAPPPAVRDEPVIAVVGAVDAPYEVPLTVLAGLPRRAQTSDFHCVASWSALDLRWEGVPFRAFYDEVLAPRLTARVTHLVFHGADGVRATVQLDDVVADDVLLAENLHGKPLTPDHGAPVRLVSPGQYGYVNIKHLCRIEVHAHRPPEPGGLLEVVLRSHPRARVWNEERHGWITGRIVRVPYALIRKAVARRHLTDRP